MAWGTYPLTDQRSMLFGLSGTLGLKGIVIFAYEPAPLETLINSPLTQGLLEINPDNRIVTSGSSSPPDFPMLPKWRKVVRAIG